MLPWTSPWVRSLVLIIINYLETLPVTVLTNINKGAIILYVFITDKTGPIWSGKSIFDHKRSMIHIYHLLTENKIFSKKLLSSLIVLCASLWSFWTMICWLNSNVLFQIPLMLWFFDMHSISGTNFKYRSELFQWNTRLELIGTDHVLSKVLIVVKRCPEFLKTCQVKVKSWPRPSKPWVMSWPRLGKCWLLCS